MSTRIVFRFLGVFLLLFAFSMSPAKSPKRLIKKGDRRYEFLSYYKALKAYKKAIEKDPANAHLNLRIADCYRHLNIPEEAEVWYREALEYPENAEDSQNGIYFIRALMNNGRYREAGEVSAKLVKKHPGLELANNFKTGSENHPLYLKDSTRYKIVNLDINTSESDFGPTLHDGDVIYSSAKDEDRFIFGWNGRYFLQLYKGAIGENTVQLEEVEHFEGRINTKYHEAIVTFNSDGDEMFFTRNNFHKGKRKMDVDGATLLKIYSSKKSGNKWKKVHGVHFNSDHYSVGHPSLDRSGNTLYFASDMPGGYGGTDIYYVSREGEDWGKPVNLGPTINSPGDEMFPWISDENILYYASNGLPGLGGLDVFFAELKGSAFSEPVNFGAPINSARDDFQLVLTNDGESGYFSSNRQGGHGDDDIYSFSARAVQYKGLVVDKVTQEPINQALVQMSGDGFPQMLNFTDPNGLFAQGIDALYPWDVVVAAEGYEVERVKLTDATPEDGGLFAKIELVKCGAVEPLNDDPVITLAGVLRDENGNPVNKGKVRVIQEMDVNDAKFKTYLDPNSEYIIEVESPDYPGPPKTYDITTSNDPGEMTPLEAIFDRNELPPGRVFYIIYYDFDKFYIREPDARPELDRVIAFMNAYPNVKIEMNSHTDCRGTFQYNESLSKNRASSSFKYITNHGISKDRFSYVWSGERQLTNNCADGQDCSEDDHQLNRRTEFKIVGWKGGFRNWENK